MRSSINLLAGGLLLCVLMYACKPESSITYELIPNGVAVQPASGAAKSLHVSFVNPGIVKVEALGSLEDTSDSSLVAIADGSVDYTHEIANGQLALRSSELLVKINPENGVVSYFDLDGNPIIKEHDGRRLKPVAIEGQSGYEVQQRFDTPDDEALYGLGQHQAYEMNYKGKNEELFQYNTKVSIPFIVSTKNYGILWDNYSMTRYGDERPYSNLDGLTLYDKEGQVGGLSATYIDDKATGHVYIERTESTIDYENLETIANFPEGFAFENAKITWEGAIASTTEGTHRFLCYYAGYTRLWVDGELQFDKWRTAWNPSVEKFEVELKAGEKREIKLEWIPDGGISYIGLKFLSPIDPEIQNDITFTSEMGQQLRYYFMTGSSIDGVISSYRTLTGKAQVMPKWSMGFWQSRERYKTEDELLGALREFRKRQIPIDNIVLDWSYWPQDQWGSHDMDLDRFPDIEGMIDEVHRSNSRIMVSVWPKFYENTEHFKQFDTKGWMYRRAVEDRVRDWIAKGYVGSFYDAYDPGARSLFWQQIKSKLYTKGFDAWWLDATEPDILSNASIEYRKQLMSPTALGPGAEFFNAYALMNAKGIYEGQRSLDSDDRVFILTRSGFAGIQRFGAVTWSGDIGTRWEDMRAQISAGVNFAMSGLPYWTMDIGGFCVEKRYERATEGSEDMKEWRELNARWYQFGAFVPLFRVHGQYPYREVFNLAPETHPMYQSQLYYNKLRYRLIPYIYSMAGWTYTRDYTIMRGLAMDFGTDEAVHTIADQYMFGPSLLINPVHTYGSRSRALYLPKGQGWYNLYTGSYNQGGQTIEADAPYERMPIYAKEGSLLLLGPDLQFTDEKPADPITVLVYAEADASFQLYEDDGTSYGYEKGDFSTITLDWNEERRTLSVGDRQGTYEGMLESRTFRVKIIDPDHPSGIDDTTGFQALEYAGKSKQMTF